MENPLVQYITLYKAHREDIDSHSAEVINARRPKACEVLEKIALPVQGSENYEVSDLPSMLAPDYGINIMRVPLDVNPSASFKCGVPKLSASLFFLLNDTFSMPEKNRQLLPEGVEVRSLREMASLNPEIVSRYYGKIADVENPLVALSDLLTQDGLWIRIKRNVKSEKALQLVNILGGMRQLMAFRRILIVVEEGAEAKMLVCDHTASGDSSLAAVQTIEIFAEAGSHFELYDLEESSSNTIRLSTLWLRQERDSRVVINGMTIYNGKTRNEYHCRFAAPGSELKLMGMGIADRERMIDNYSEVEHDCGHCKTDELFKYSVDDNARCAFTGMVRVATGAEKTEAYQSNRNLIGSDGARMYSKPQLEIYNDDVKCSHGSATGRLDEKQLFYMRTRGLSEAEARLLLKQAFMSDVIDSVEMPGLKERLTHIVARRFAGEKAGCHDCGSDCPVI